MKKFRITKSVVQCHHDDIIIIKIIHYLIITYAFTAVLIFMPCVLSKSAAIYKKKQKNDTKNHKIKGQKKFT